MSSQAQASLELPGVLGLAFVGFPLDPAKRVAVDKAEHLSKVNSQCSSCRERAMSWPICQTCVPPCERATLHLIEDADHVFHVRVLSRVPPVEIATRQEAKLRVPLDESNWLKNMASKLSGTFTWLSAWMMKVQVSTSTGKMVSRRLKAGLRERLVKTRAQSS